MFLHFQRFQNFRSYLCLFLLCHKFPPLFPNHALRNAHFSRVQAFRQGKPPLYFVACYYAQCNTEESPKVMCVSVCGYTYHGWRNWEFGEVFTVAYSFGYNLFLKLLQLQHRNVNLKKNWRRCKRCIFSTKQCFSTLNLSKSSTYPGRWVCGRKRSFGKTINNTNRWPNLIMSNKKD